MWRAALPALLALAFVVSARGHTEGVVQREPSRTPRRLPGHTESPTNRTIVALFLQETAELCPLPPAPIGRDTCSAPKTLMPFLQAPW